jgi:hypothetical protein
MSVTKEQIASAINTVHAVAEAIRAAKEIPSGVLYATLMPTGITIDKYESIIGTLTRAKLVQNKSHVLKWIGPNF